MYEIFKESTNGHQVKDGVITVGSEREALDFCNENGWVLFDENGYMWELDYRKVA